MIFFVLDAYRSTRLVSAQDKQEPRHDRHARSTSRRYAEHPRQPWAESLHLRSGPGAAAGGIPAAGVARRMAAAPRTARRPCRRRAGRAGAGGGQEPAGAGAAHPPRRGFAEHSQASGLRRPRTGGLCRTWPGFHEPSPGRPAAAGEVCAHPPVRTGRVRPLLPGQHDRLADPHPAQVRRARTGRALPAVPRLAGFRRAVPGRHVHDRAGRRLRRGADPYRGAGGGRRVEALRRQVVLLQPGRRPGDGPGPARRRAGRNEGRDPVPVAEGPRGRHAQRLSHRPPEG
ncbi:Uncharacterised protein [Acinetobacter baumannii]|nr:Uncharacterised protein [Acinetobacter baumannii]